MLECTDDWRVKSSEGIASKYKLVIFFLLLYNKEKQINISISEKILSYT